MHCVSHVCLTIQPSQSALNPLPRDCREALLIGGGVDGTYVIFPNRVGECNPLMVYCDQGADGGGWTVRQSYTVCIYFIYTVCTKMVWVPECKAKPSQSGELAIKTVLC